MSQSGRGFSDFFRTLVLVGIILITLAIGATTGGPNGTAAAPAASPSSAIHEPPNPDVERARTLVEAAEMNLPSPAKENENKPNSPSGDNSPVQLAPSEAGIQSINNEIIEAVATAGYITESWYSYAPGIDNFRTSEWLSEIKPEVAGCQVQIEGKSHTFGEAIDIVADSSGANPRVLLIFILMQSSFSATNDLCHQAQQQVIELLALADEMTDLRLSFRAKGEGGDRLSVNPALLERREDFHNDVSFAVAHATTMMAIRAGRAPQEITAEFYKLFNQYFGDPKDAPPYLLSDDMVSSVTYLMPYYSGYRAFTGGPHGGGTTAPCAGVSLSDVSGLDFGYPSDPTAIQNAVVAIADGEIVGLKNTDSNPGKWVAVRHDNGVVSMYWHLSYVNSALFLTQRISAGAYLGDIGNTGCPGCGIHIHLELRQGGANYNNFSGIGAPVAWTERVIDGWRIYPQVFASGNAANYNGTALKNSAINGNFQKEITACSGKTIASVEYNFPYSNETNTEITKFAQANRSTLLPSTNNIHCPATAATNDFFSESTDSLCGGNSDTTPPSASGFSASVSEGRTANITTSGVQDNSGGGGVKEVKFSAKWGGNWYGIGADSSSPYTLTWDMCASNVPNGDVELGMEVWDNAGNKWVWSEHYGNPHISKNSACGGSGDPQPGGEWHANFWMNKYLAGYVNWDVFYLWDDGKWPYIWFDWGINGPKEGWSGDEFSLRIWRNVYFPGGRYEFRTESDDGVRVYVDGQIVIDHWWDANTGAGGGKDISSGWHEVKVEYYENTGNARLYVYWFGPGYPQPDEANPDGRITVPTHLSAVNSNPLTIAAEAWDDASGVNFVRFMAHYCQSGSCGWHELGTDNSAPYSIAWDWAAIGEQHVWLAIHVADKSGKITYDPGGWVEVDLDKTSPAAEIITPTDGAYLIGNSVQFSALANDGGSGIGSVQFFVGYDDGSAEYWHELGFDTNGADGWNKSWNASGVNDQRDVSFFIYAYDKAGNFASAASWAAVLDRKPPTSAVQSLPTTSPASFTVQWSGSDATSGLAGFDIDYQQDGGAWTRWKTGVTETSATFTGSSNHTYGFRSRAFDMAGHLEAWPTSADAVTSVSSTIPAPPLNVQASDGTLIAQVRITWTQSEGATYYELYRSAPGSATKEFVHKRDGQYSFTDDNNGDGTVLEYALKACSDQGCSAFSNFDTGYADMPVLHSIDNANGDGNYTVAWTPAKTASHHEAQESHDGGVWTNIYSGKATSIDRTGKGDGQWCYRVRGYNGIQEYSPWTNPQCTNVGDIADTIQPQVDWQLPVTNGEIYVTSDGEQIQLSAHATDNQGVEYLQFLRYDAVDNEWVTLSEDWFSPYQTVLDADSLQDGYNQIDAWAYDAAGNVGASYIWVYLGGTMDQYKLFAPAVLGSQQ